jgi:hypothetical protein
MHSMSLLSTSSYFVSRLSSSTNRVEGWSLDFCFKNKINSYAKKSTELLKLLVIMKMKISDHLKLPHLQYIFSEPSVS